MGCAQSRIDNEEAVSRCKDRKILMKEALVARNAFAAGHTGYAMSLKNTGAALSDYGHGEAEKPQNLNTHNDPLDPILQPHMDTVLPPPPLPDFSPILLKRSATMPEFSVSKPSLRNDSNTIMEDEDEVGAEDGDNGGGDLRPRSRRNGVVEAEQEAPPLPPPSPPRTPPITAVPPPPPETKGAWDYFFMPGPSFSELEEDIGDAKDEMFDAGKNVNVDKVEPKTPEKVVEKAAEMPGKKATQIVHSNTAPPVPVTVPEVRRGSSVVSSVSLLKLLGDIDDHFLKASESAQEVTKMLEANRLHYHSNFADNRGHIDHSARVMRVITWNRSFRGLQNAEGRRDDFDAEEQETHASVLDKLVAWEKKLYEEVKAGELMKIEYQKKVALLNKQKKRGASAESLEKTKAAVSHLHTRYIVDMQSMDSTVSEVNRLRDYQLYPKLVALVDGMAKMWESMCEHHDSQLKLATDLKSFDIAHAPKETSKHHHDQTIQLWNVIQEWHSQFDKLVTHQKQYIRALNSWLKLNLIPIESSLKEKISSPPKVQIPPVQTLLHSWIDYLEKLPDELAKTAIFSFAAVIKTIIIHQEEEMRLKDKCEETNKEFLRKEQAFNEWLDKYRNRRTQSDETDPERGDGTATKDPVSEKQFAVDSLRKRLEEEVEAHKKHCLQVREKSLGSLKTRLPELFRALSDYSHACSDAYEQLSSIAQSHNRNSGPS